MSTGVRRLFKAAKKALIPAVGEFGFQRYRTTSTFVRRAGDIYHFISLAGSRWGGRFYVYVTAWTPEMEESSTTPTETFRRGMNTIRLGGRLSPRMVGEGTWSWDYGTDSLDEASLAEVAECLQRIAMPWFACMSDREQIARALGRNASDEVKARIVSQESVPPDFGIADSLPKFPYCWRPGELEVICENSFFDEGDDERFLAAGGSELAEEMRVRGFELQRAPVFRFRRQDGKYIWAITLEPASNGVHFISRICTFSRQAARHVYGSVNAELMNSHFWQVNGGWLSSQGIDEFGTPWLVAGPDSIKAMIPRFLQAVDQHGVPWFERVSSDEAFLKSLNADFLPAGRYQSLSAALMKSVEKGN